MGCQNSHLMKTGPRIKISIVDEIFMKNQHEDIRKEMQNQNIEYEYFISLQCFIQQFKNRYYNKIVTNVQNYPLMKSMLLQIGLTPNIYVVLNHQKLEQASSFNVTVLQSYGELIRYLRENYHSHVMDTNQRVINMLKKKINVKVLCKPGQRTSQQTIFETAMKKGNISYQFFNSFQLLQQSLFESQCLFVVSDYIFHKEVVQLFRQTKTLVFCYCQFDKSEVYSSELYSVSNNYLDITSDIKNYIKRDFKHSVKCSKVYLYQKGLNDEQGIIKTLNIFDIEVRTISNLQKIIKQTTYFFCVTVIVGQLQSKNVAKFLQRNDYLERVKILSISTQTQSNVKGLFKLIRNIKKGYKVIRSVTNSIDIIDKHYNSTKFQQIKKELQSNQIRCFGYSTIGQYIRNKKFISPFIICNYDQKLLLVKYMKQLQCHSKLIIFCNKNKINIDISQNKLFSFVSSHFGKIIKYIKQTLVYIPIINRQEQQEFQQKIQKLKIKNKRISALKWSNVNGNCQDSEVNFQFLNIAKDTNHGSIKDIQKVLAQTWKTNESIKQLQTFKGSFIHSLCNLRKNNKINLQQNQFNILLQKIKNASIYELLQKIKTFFDADNELGLQINRSLLKAQRLQKYQIQNIKQFLLLSFLNYFSGYQIPRITHKKLVHWIISPLIQNCQIGSYLFCKHFTIFYQDNNSKLQQIGKYKIQLSLVYNTLIQQQLLINSFVCYKDKVIFAPFSQFQVEGIRQTGQYKVVTVKFIKNIDFLMYIFKDNFLRPHETLATFANQLINTNNNFVDEIIRQKFTNNILRINSIQLFHHGQIHKAISIHKKLIQDSQDKQNLDSALINQLNYQLIHYYLKIDMNRQAAQKIHQLLQCDPGSFIKSQCQKIVQDIIICQKQGICQMEGKKNRKISQEAMKTFIWLKSKKDQMESQKSDQSNNGEEQAQSDILCSELKCIQIEDIQSA